MNLGSNSEMFERAARREVTAFDAAGMLMAHDEDVRARNVSEARPRWMPSFLWACATAIIVALLDSLQRRS